MSETSTGKKLNELYDLIKNMDVAIMTTRSSDGRLVSRPMATQQQSAMSDLWFVTNIETHKVDQIENDPNVSIAYFNSDTMEWVSVSGKATITQDRAKIKELWEPDWKAWFGDEGGERDGSADDPRLALIYVDTETANYMKSKYSKPRVLFELARGMITGESADLGREEHLSEDELD